MRGGKRSLEGMRCIAEHLGLRTYLLRKAHSMRYLNCATRTRHRTARRRPAYATAALRVYKERNRSFLAQIQILDRKRSSVGMMRETAHLSRKGYMPLLLQLKKNLAGNPNNWIYLAMVFCLRGIVRSMPRSERQSTSPLGTSGTKRSRRDAEIPFRMECISYFLGWLSDLQSTFYNTRSLQ